MRKALKWLLSIVAFVVVAVLTFVVIVPMAVPAFGARAGGAQLERMRKSANFNDGRFVNLVDTPMNSTGDSIFSAFLRYFWGNEERTPEDTISTGTFNRHAYSGSDSLLKVTWFGHSTVLLHIDGKTLLIDPVFSDHASPFPFMGPKAFPYSTAYSIDDLPPVDAVLISHDHYDHLDYETILQLKDRVNVFYVPLGLSAHLMRWGVPESGIRELDWWDEAVFEGLTLACVPMRHFSGRGVTDRFCTLWAGWVVKGKNHSVIHTGDSGYGTHFKEIGDRYGPFDLTMVECGQYNENWKFIHMMPEETVQAHIDLKGDYLLPIHWGRFNLSLHAWKEPVERALARAQQQEIQLLTPRAGHTFTINPPLPRERWWRKKGEG